MSIPPHTPPTVLVDARFTIHRRGGDRCRFELAKELMVRSPGRYRFLTYDHGRDLLQTQSPEVETFVASCLPSEHPGAEIFEHFTLPRLSRKAGVELYHGTFQVLPLRRSAPRQVVTIHDMATFEFPEAYGRKFAIYMRFLIGRAIAAADTIITVSNATQVELLKWFPTAGSKCTTVLNGVGAEFLIAGNTPPDQAAEVCRRLKIPLPFILYVGNLERKKNLPRLVQAFAQLRQAGDATHHLVIVGSRPDNLPDVGLDSKLVGPGSRVHFTGYVADADLPAIYRASAAVAYPSLYEGFGMPVLEAMAVGVPVLTSNLSSLPEVAGGAAMLVDPTDVDDIARGLRAILDSSDWRSSAVAAGRRRAAELSWSAHAAKVEAVYDRLLPPR